MNRKLLFFDIDGTLAQPGQLPTRAVVEAIQKARHNGHLAFLSTGRPQWLVPDAIMSIGFDGGIFHAGGRAVVHNHVILDECMPETLACEVVELLRRERNIYFMLECADRCYRSDPEPFFRYAEESRGGSSELRRLMQDLMNPAHPDQRDYRGEKIYKISYFTADRAQTARITEELAKRGKAVWFQNMLDGTELGSGEVTALGTDKGKALRAVCSCCGGEIGDCIAFGDSMNDAEMIQAAGLGIAMDNAEPRLKAMADRICESVDEDGVVRELERLGLI